MCKFKSIMIGFDGKTMAICKEILSQTRRVNMSNRRFFH